MSRSRVRVVLRRSSICRTIRTISSMSDIICRLLKVCGALGMCVLVHHIFFCRPVFVMHEHNPPYSPAMNIDHGRASIGLVERLNLNDPLLTVRVDGSASIALMVDAGHHQECELVGVEAFNRSQRQ